MICVRIPTKFLCSKYCTFRFLPRRSLGVEGLCHGLSCNHQIGQIVIGEGAEGDVVGQDGGVGQVVGVVAANQPTAGSER